MVPSSAAAASSSGDRESVTRMLPLPKNWRRVVLLVPLLLTCCMLYLMQQEEQSFNSVSQDEGFKTVKMQNCNCSRRVPASGPVGVSTDGLEYDAANTTCSDDAFERGSGQRVVGFSFYGDINADASKKKGYFEGIVGNLVLMHKFYPGWIMRVYFDLDQRDPILKELCDLACDNPVLDLCHAGKLPGTPMADARKVFAMNWRFFPTLDPQVDLFASRDLDSRFSPREKAAVADFVSASSADPSAFFHCMRDHPHHGAVVVGNAWGARTDLGKKGRDRWKRAWRRAASKEGGMMFADREKWGPDQDFLRRYVWPWAKKHALCHDSYHCRKYPRTRPFPTRREEGRKNNFVGSVHNNMPVLEEECPEKCRPEGHEDWLLC